MKMKKTKIVSLFLVLILTLGLVAGCGGSTDSNTAKTNNVSTTDNNKNTGAGNAQKDKLTVAIDSDIVSIDPMGHNSSLSALVSYALYSRLFAYDKEGNVVPELADQWEYLSDTELKISIKKGVKFHDSSEMKAEDVKASLERAMVSPKVKYVLKQVDKIDVVDDYTVLITTKVPFAPLLNNLVHSGCSIIPKKFIEAGEDFKNPIGSGAYKFVSWKSGDRVELVRFDDYFDKANVAKMEKLVLKIIPEGTNRTIALETGEVDLVTKLETIDYERVKGNNDLQTVELVSNNINYLAMNVEKAPFDNKLVRQAFNYAINKDAVLEVTVNGIGKNLDSFVPGYTPSTNYKYDPEKAKALLKEAGYVQGDQKIIISASGDDKSRTAQVIQGNLADIGINAEIELMDLGAYLEATSAGEHQLCVMAWTTAPDPDRFFTPLLSKSSINSQNRARYANDEVDKLIQEGASTLNSQKREEIYKQVHELGMDDAPWVPLFSKKIVMGVNGKLKCEDCLNPSGHVFFNKIGY